ncbi:MAG: phenylalanine--tRNA ligase subunit beta, partial [Eubacteriales bacterium]
AATYNAPLNLHTPVVKGGAEGNLFELLDVETPAEELCPRYTAKMVRNVKIAPSPRWMRERLRSAGVRPINNIVDITNYVMLEYGQPMHAFDYRYVTGGKIIVRCANEGEQLTTLDGNVHTLNANHLVIADETKAVGLAGIMGGMNSEIVDDTVDVVFESANFDGGCIRKGAVSLNMRTDASAKFEKGLDAMNTLPAVERACELVELLGAGEVVDGTIDILNYVPTPTVLALEPEKINNLLGTDVPTADMVEYLERIGFTVEGDQVAVPSWRGDVAHYSDVAEEVARFYGYNNIPNTMMSGTTTHGGYSAHETKEQELGAHCRSLGFSEIITYSFISPSYYDKIRWAQDDPRRNSLKILNPLGEDTSMMRTTTLPSMLEILARNFNFRNKAVRLYEFGRTYFTREDGLAEEPKILSLGAFGDMDFFDLKGKVDSILSTLRPEKIAYTPCKTNPSYHPGRCATVSINGVEVGVLGQIHPLVAQNYGVDVELYCAELSFETMFANQGEDPLYTPLPKFPSVSRDLALVCDEAITVAELSDCILANGGKLLRSATLFDIYRGTGVPEGKKSVAFSLELRADDRTLTDEDSTSATTSVLAALEAQLGAVLR